MSKGIVVLSLVLTGLILGGLVVVQRSAVEARRLDRPLPTRPYDVRRTLFKELQPIKLSNCTLERFGEPNDGGYLLCANLLDRVQAGYSYGISGYDGWGCDISRKLNVPLHQYDCFNTTRPICEGGQTVFHPECVGVSKEVQDGRPFDTIANQVVVNGDRGKRLVMKMDVEGAEWDSFMSAPDEVLQRIDQLTVEFHGVDRAQYVHAVRRLKQFFYVVHLHWNNYACLSNGQPFPAWAYEVLFVNKRIGTPDPLHRPVLPHPLDARNNPASPDC